MIEATSDYYSLREVWQMLSSRFKRKAETAPEAEVLRPVPTWSPRTELERTVLCRPLPRRRARQQPPPGRVDAVQPGARISVRHPARGCNPPGPQGSRGPDQLELNLSPGLEPGLFLKHREEERVVYNQLTMGGGHH